MKVSAVSFVTQKFFGLAGSKLRKNEVSRLMILDAVESIMSALMCQIRGNMQTFLKQLEMI